MIKSIAIDDEPFALEVVRSHAAKVPFLELASCFTDPFQAIDYLAAEPVQLLFLDIKMPDLTGMELLQSLTPKPLVIFTTAYTEYAAESYELDAVDYLIKPFSFPRFLKACNKANEMLQKSTGVAIKEDSSIFIKSGYEAVRINYLDILFLESAGNYMTFVLADEKRILSRLTISETVNLLPPAIFTRVHRSFIVNRLKIDRKERHQVHIGKYAIPISSSFTSSV